MNEHIERSGTPERFSGSMPQVSMPYLFGALFLAQLTAWGVQGAAHAQAALEKKGTNWHGCMKILNAPLTGKEKPGVYYFPGVKAQEGKPGVPPAFVLVPDQGAPFRIPVKPGDLERSIKTGGMLCRPAPESKP
jgi:hypothetical protein